MTQGGLIVLIVAMNELLVYLCQELGKLEFRAIRALKWVSGQ